MLADVLPPGGMPVRELFTVMTRKGQITVPVEIRRALGLREGDKVALTLCDGQVRLSRARSVVDETAGVLRSRQPALSAEELRTVAEQVIAEDVVARMNS